jgi:hypothetical protein
MGLQPNGHFNSLNRMLFSIRDRPSTSIIRSVSGVSGRDQSISRVPTLD